MHNKYYVYKLSPSEISGQVNYFRLLGRRYVNAMLMENQSHFLLKCYAYLRISSSSSTSNLRSAQKIPLLQKFKKDHYVHCTFFVSMYNFDKTLNMLMYFMLTNFMLQYTKQGAYLL